MSWTARAVLVKPVLVDHSALAGVYGYIPGCWVLACLTPSWCQSASRDSIDRELLSIHMVQLVQFLNVKIEAKFFMADICWQYRKPLFSFLTSHLN